MSNRDDVVFMFVGDGVRRDFLLNAANSLPNVMVFSRVSSRDVPTVISVMDVCYCGLKPKKIYQFGVSLAKSFEYMASGKPILWMVDAFNNPVRESGGGFEIEAGNPLALVDAIEQCASMSKNDLIAMGRKSYSFIEKNHSYDVLGQKWGKLVDEFDISIENNEDLSEILEQIKTLESRGFSFESAEASIALMLHRKKDGYEAPFELIDFSATVENREGRGVFAEAMVKIRVNDEVIHTIAEGNGPVNALDSALRKGLIPIYPRLEEFQLADYKVRIIDGSNGTASITRVLIDTQNGHKRWSTVGASPNIIEASWLALVDSMEYGLSNL